MWPIFAFLTDIQVNSILLIHNKGQEKLNSFKLRKVLHRNEIILSPAG